MNFSFSNVIGELRDEKFLPKLSLVVILLSVVAFALTGRYFLLFAPLPWLYFSLAFKDQKLAYWILLFCIPFSIRIELAGNTFSIALPDQPMMWLFLLFTILAIAYKPDLISRVWLLNPIVLIVVLQFAWLIVSVYYSKVPFLSFKFLLAKTWFLAAFFIFPSWVFHEKKDFKKGFLLMLIPMVGTMLLVLTRQSLYRFRFADIKYAIGSVYNNHVEYSTVISMFFPLVCMAYPLTKELGTKVRRAVLALILFFLLAIFFSYARAAILGLAFAFLVMLAIKARVVNLVMPAIYGLIALGLTYVVSNYNYMKFTPNYERTFMHKEFTDHVRATFRGRDISSMERIYRWVAAVRMSKESPFVGFGPHAFYYNYKSYALPVFKTYVSDNPEKSTTHNYFLYVLSEQGYPAMLLYALLIMVVFAQAQATYHRCNDQFYKNCTMGLAMMFAVSFINNFFSELIETHKAGSLFYLSMSLLVILDLKSRGVKPNRGLQGEHTTAS